MVGTENITTLMNEPAGRKMWQHALGKLGDKYKMWARFPQIPTMNSRKNQVYLFINSKLCRLTEVPLQRVDKKGIVLVDMYNR